ncbi:MAG: hypothetical protein JRJ77_05235 [Deltaproteobacteria bacterium]|nr:hypothetical protein [Deltaproteobacteria bacterium]
MKGIIISAEDISVSGELNDTFTAQKIWEALPLEGTAKTWGDEIYFETPLVIEQEQEARADVEVGDLGYWPPGNAICIFFGPTPASTGEDPRAASPVNIFGSAKGNATRFRAVQGGATVRIGRSDKEQG